MRWRWRWSGVSRGHLSGFLIQLLLNLFGLCRPRHSVRCAWSAPPWWSRTLRGTCPSASMIRRKTWSSLHMAVFNRWPRSPWARLWVFQTRLSTFKMALVTLKWFSTCPYRKSCNPKNERYFQWLWDRHWLAWSQISFERVICTQQQLISECDQHKCDTLILGQL